MKTKRILLLLFLNVVVVVTFAQKVRMGFLGGVNLAVADYDFPAPQNVDNAYLNTWQADQKPGFFVGYDVEYDFTDKVFASSGLILNYNQFNAVNQRDYLNSENLDEYRSQFSLFELQLPLMLHYRVGKFSAGLGPYAALAVGGSLKYRYLQNGDQENSFDETLVFNNSESKYADFRPLNVGFGTEIGYGIKRWRVAAHFDLGLSNLSPKLPSQDSQVQKYALKRSNLGLSFLYQPWPR